MAAAKWIISGPSGSGKSTWCGELARRARERGLNPQGVVSPCRFENQRKAGIDIVDLATDERRRLASARVSESNGLMTDDWCFETSALEWANGILSQIEHAPMVILDELGPLEFTRGVGLVEGLGLLDRRSTGTTVVVIRPKHLHQALARWPESAVVDMIQARPLIEVVLEDVHALHP
jgi:nucleoside-triphosphatase